MDCLRIGCVVAAMILDNDVLIKKPERDKLAADVAAWIAKHGEPVCVAPDVSGDTYCARMNQHAVAQRKEIDAKQAAARRRGARNKSQA